MTGFKSNRSPFPVSAALGFLEQLRYRGKGRYCEVCNSTSRKFKPFGDPLRLEARCWRCRSLERHRFLCHYLNSNPDNLELTSGHLLHIAPEHCLRPYFRQRFGEGYITADKFARNVDVAMDISNIQFPDGHFDAIYCSHVLEHVPDDLKAMREFARVLKPDGWAILLVPIDGKTTYEDPSIQTPEGRKRAFGQSDHLRIYGEDYVDRLETSGFKVKRIRPGDIMSPQEIVTFGIGSAAGDIFLCHRA